MPERMLSANGVELNVWTEGAGPPVVLAHGFPELGYSWRHQVSVIADAGYTVIAPDQRGYGRSSRPPDVESYDIHHLCGDLLSILDNLGHDKAVFVGHDWGSMIVWHLALLRPERVAGVVGMSVPFMPRSPVPPISAMKAIFGDSFFYILYFETPGLADEDLGRDPARTMRGFLAGPLRADSGGVGTDRDAAAGFVARLPPADDHRGTVIVDGAGHWVQQERPGEVKSALLDFLAGLERDGRTW